MFQEKPVSATRQPATKTTILEQLQQLAQAAKVKGQQTQSAAPKNSDGIETFIIDQPTSLGQPTPAHPSSKTQVELQDLTDDARDVSTPITLSTARHPVQEPQLVPSPKQGNREQIRSDRSHPPASISPYSTSGTRRSDDNVTQIFPIPNPSSTSPKRGIRQTLLAFIARIIRDL